MYVRLRFVASFPAKLARETKKVDWDPCRDETRTEIDDDTSKYINKNKLKK